MRNLHTLVFSNLKTIVHPPYLSNLILLLIQKVKLKSDVELNR